VNIRFLPGTIFVNHPCALPIFLDDMPVLVNPYPEWNSKYGVLVCGKKYADSYSVIEDCAAIIF